MSTRWDKHREKRQARRSMDPWETYGMTGRSFKLVYYGNLFLCIGLAMCLIVFIIIELMKGSSQTRIQDVRHQPLTFRIPDMREILSWGANGQGVKVNSSKLYPGHREEYEDGFTRFHLNKYLSDRISMRRPLPDVRSQDCQLVSNDLTRLPSVSLVIVFRNEPRTTLLRMLYSVIDRSPEENIKDIVLVDDSSDVEDLQFPTLEHYVSGLKKVIIIRLPTQHGLARARMHGARRATGELLIFLQPRCECTEGWMTPLLELVASDRATIAVPVVDRIDYDTFQYYHDTSSELKVGSFTWDLTTRKRNLTKLAENATLSLTNPVLADGIFAIDRDKFFTLGGFDENLMTEDSVNIEFSFRSWMCGCQIVIQPCSHVGYMFPLADHEKPDKLSNETIKANLRIADAWMGSYKYFVYERMQAGTQAEIAHLNSAQAPQRVSGPERGNNCRDFDWYLQTIEPVMSFTKEISRRGQIVMLGAKNRILSLGVSNNDAVLQDWISSPAVFWYHLKSGRLVTENKTCLSYEPGNKEAENIPSSVELKMNFLNSNYNQIDAAAVRHMKIASVDSQNTNNVDSVILQADKFEDQLVANLLVADSNRSALRRLLANEDQQFNLNKQRQSETDADKSQSKVGFDSHQKIDEKTFESYRRSRDILNSILDKSDVIRQSATQPKLKARLKTQDQSGNMTYINEPDALPTSRLILKSCENESEGEQWIYTEAQTLEHVQSGLCISADKSKYGKYLLSLVQCDRSSWAQQWNFITSLLSH